MISPILLLQIVSLVFAFQGSPAQENVSPAVFVGTWVGMQTWALENAPPSAKEPQPVTLTIDLVDGKLVGSMTPFFGGSDVAKIVEYKIVGDELQASAIVGQPPPATPDAAAQPPRRGWTDGVKVNFLLKADRTDLTGTADILLGDVKWLKFKYELGKKRLRY